MQKFATKKFVKPVVAVILIFLGLSWFFFFRQSSNQKLSAPLQKGNIVKSVYGIGTVTANHSFIFKPGVTSTVTDIFVREGDAVKKGDAVVALDGVKFLAPFSGVITELTVKVLENVFAQSLVFSLVDLSDRYLVVALEQRAALDVRSGQNVKLSFEDLRDAAFNGRVEAVYANANGFFVRIGVADLPANILPGMTADVAIIIDEHRDVLLIPVAALTGSRVQVKRPNQPVQNIDVKLGFVDAAWAEVQSGELRVGDRLLLP